MVENLKKAVLDTNVLVSAITRGGKPRKILSLVLTKGLEVIISPVLLAELTDVLGRKFDMASDDITLIEEEVRKNFVLIHPISTVEILKTDPDDNRVLEAAVDGGCDFIVTGDRELLNLKVYKHITTLTPTEFLRAL